MEALLLENTQLNLNAELEPFGTALFSIDSKNNPFKMPNAHLPVTGGAIESDVESPSIQPMPETSEGKVADPNAEILDNFVLGSTQSASAAIPNPIQSANLSIDPLTGGSPTLPISPPLTTPPTPIGPTPIVPIPDIPLFPLGKPDLIVTALETTGEASVRGSNVILPVDVTVKNQGNGFADPFKVSVEYTTPGNSQSYVVAFTAEETSNVNPDTGFYPFTRNVLSPGQDVTFTGELTFIDTSLLGQQLSLTAIADSTSGDEFIPSYGRVDESNEDNNSATLTVRPDSAGNSLDEARSISGATSGKTYSEWVGNDDTEDYYSFSLGSQNDFTLSLDGLSADVSVQLLDSNGNVIQDLNNPIVSIPVVPIETLPIETLPTVPTIPGLGGTVANNSGAIANVNLPPVTVNPDLLVPDFGGGIDLNLGVAPKSTSGTLDAGSYHIRVSSIGNTSTAYNLNLSVDPSVNPLFQGITTEGSDAEIFVSTAQSGSLINLDDFRSTAAFSGIDGSGWSTVVIDNGIDLDHPFFGADGDGDGVADRIVDSFDFADDDGDASDNLPAGVGAPGHGSNVTSIAASQHGTFTGMAPGADIIHLKVFGDDGTGNFGATEQALQWVIDNAGTYNIASVNLSLGDNQNWTNDDSRYGLGDELQKLADLGVIVASSSGNSFFGAGSTQGVAYPAADSNSLAIGAVYDANLGRIDYADGTTAFTTAADRITPFSQRHNTLTDVLAPGGGITGANGTGGTVTMDGTSQASPHVAGIAVLAQQLAVDTLGRSLSPNEFRNLLVSTGVTVNDGDDENDNVTNTGLDFKRVNLTALADEIVGLQTVNVTVQRIREIDNIEPDFIIPDDPDFYTIISIAGDEWTSPPSEGSDLSPNWFHRSGATTSSVPIRISIFDKDGFLRFDDDHVDLNPAAGRKDLNLTYDLLTGEITDADTGSLLGNTGELIVSQGEGDSDRGEISFRIDHNS